MKNKFDNFGDDFFGRWVHFNRLLNESPLFKDEMEKIIQILTQSRDFNDFSDFKITPIGVSKKDDLEYFDIPEDEMDIEKGEDDMGKWERKSWTSPDGSMSYNAFSRSSSPENFMSEDLIGDLFSRYKSDNTKKYNAEELKNFKIEKLQKYLNAAVEVEDYEKAVELKKTIDKLKEENFDNKK